MWSVWWEGEGRVWSVSGEKERGGCGVCGAGSVSGERERGGCGVCGGRSVSGEREREVWSVVRGV